jgi:hypothetical protein
VAFAEAAPSSSDSPPSSGRTSIPQPLILPMHRKHAISCAQKSGQAQIDEIDSSHAKSDVSRRHHPLVQDVIKEVQQAGFRNVQHLIDNGNVMTFSA